MILQSWLRGLYEDEAESAGESAAAGVVETSTATTEPSVPDADTSAAAPSSEPVIGPLVSEDHDKFEAFFDQMDRENEAENTSKAKKNSASEATAAEGGDDAGNEPVAEVQRNALVSMAEAYDWTKEELKGFTSEQLKRLIDREEKRLSQATGQPADAEAKTEVPKTPESDEADDPFEAFAARRKVQLENQGFDEEYIDTEIERDRMLWDSNQQLQQQLLTSEQQRQQERMAHVWELEKQEFDNLLIARCSELGLRDIVGTKSYRELTAAEQSQMQARSKVMQQYQVLRQTRPNFSPTALVQHAINSVFHDQIMHRDRVKRSRDIIEHSQRRMASTAPATAQKDAAWEGPVESDPVLVRAMQRVKNERHAGAV